MSLKWFTKCFRRSTGDDALKRRSSRKHRRVHLTPSQKLKIQNLEKVLKDLECPICFNTCIPPIFTCVNGHLICSKCRRRVQECPTCREGFSSTRNRFAENFIEQYSQPCKYIKEGCKFLRWKGDNMTEHEAKCHYRPIRCLIPECECSVGYQSLVKHLIDAHQVTISSRLPTTISYCMKMETTIQDRKWKPYCLNCYGSTFCVLLEIERPFFWGWVYQCCPKAELTERFNFIYTMRFESSKSILLEWRGPVYSARTSRSMIKRDGLCFGGAEAQLQHFVEDDRLLMIVHIEPVPGGFSDGSISDDGLGEITRIPDSQTILRSTTESDSEINANGDTEHVNGGGSNVFADMSVELLRRRSTSNLLRPPSRSSRSRTPSRKKSGTNYSSIAHRTS